MKQLYYTLRTLIRGKGSNFTKILSLTLGFSVGILLFARIAFEKSYDTNYNDAEHLYVINCAYTINGKTDNPVPIVFAPMPSALLENFPKEIESATVVAQCGKSVYYNGSHRFESTTIYADSLYFKTMGIGVISGDPKSLNTPDIIFIARSLARKLYGDSNPDGKVLMMNKSVPMTVKGVFEDIPENCGLQHEIVGSFITMVTRFGRGAAWTYDDSYNGFVRFRSSKDVAAVEKRFSAIIAQHFDKLEENGFAVKYSFQPILEQHSSYPEVHKMIVIMLLLGIAILLVAVLNYVLISVSSLPLRAKAVGVHKCSGASSGTVFKMFMFETAIIVLVSLILMALLLFNFKDVIEDIVSASYSALFCWQNIWVPMLVIFIIFIVAGVLPGRLFAFVPVTQVFRRYTDRKTSWKRPLLFIQFMGAAFIFGLLFVVLLQYNRLMNKGLGYDPENVYSVQIHGLNGTSEIENLKDEFRRMPIVESVATTQQEIISGYDGMPIRNANGIALFTSRANDMDFDYLPLMGITLVEGRNVKKPNEVLINEEFVRRMHWSDSPIGKSIYDYQIVGVMKDFPVQSYYGSQDAVAYRSNRLVEKGLLVVRTKESSPEVLAMLNKKIGEMYPTEDMQFYSLRKKIDSQYEAVRRFRDSVTIASISILLIALMGLIGYVNDEIRRRSKEIAIRKVNGAEASSILELLSKDIIWVTIPSVVAGVIGSYFIGAKWLEQFAEQIELRAVWFLSVAIVVVAVILGCVVCKAWHIANDNPVNSIKSE